MSTDDWFLCGSCDERHPGPPLSYAVGAPAAWTPEAAADPRSVLDTEVCRIGADGFFVRGLIEIPVHDSPEPFAWNVWVSLSAASFDRTGAMWDRPERVDEPAYFGWLSSEVAAYDVSTINLKTNVHTREVGLRPAIELEPTDHPLAVEQREGITLRRVQEIAERLLHQS